MHRRIWAAQTVWRHIQGLNTHVLGPTQSDRLRRESSKNSLITTQYEKKKKKKKLQGEAGLQFGPQGSLVRRKKWRGWPLVVLTASISYLKGKRRLAVRLIRESVGNVSGHYAKCTAAGIQRFLTFVSISRMLKTLLFTKYHNSKFF